MDRETILATLRAHEPELKAEGVLSLSLFGSAARGDNTPESDIDLMADFDTGRKYSLIDRIRLENRLTAILGVRVDLSSTRMLYDEVREQAVREALLAF